LQTALRKASEQKGGWGQVFSSEVCIHSVRVRFTLSFAIAFVILSLVWSTQAIGVNSEPSLGTLYGYESLPSEMSYAQLIWNAAGQGDYAFDEDGIVMVFYPSGWHYNPLTIASQGMYYYYSLCTAVAAGTVSSAVDLKFKIEKVYHFLKRIEMEKDAMTLLPYAFSYWDIGEPSWVSALAQAVYLAFLDRCLEQRIGEASDVKLAIDGVLSSLETDVSEGGVASTDSDGFFWLEEYASVDSGLRHTLNGQIYAARILQRYAQAHPEDERAQALFDRSLPTLMHYIPLYTTDDGVLYSADSPKMTPRTYFSSMTAIMESFGDELGDPWWYEWADRWQALEAHTGDAQQRRSAGIRLRYLLVLWGVVALLGAGVGAWGVHPILRRHMYDPSVRRAIRLVAFGIGIVVIGTGILAGLYLLL